MPLCIYFILFVFFNLLPPISSFSSGIPSILFIYGITFPFFQNRFVLKIFLSINIALFFPNLVIGFFFTIILICNLFIFNPNMVYMRFLMLVKSIFIIFLIFVSYLFISIRVFLRNCSISLIMVNLSSIAVENFIKLM